MRSLSELLDIPDAAKWVVAPYKAVETVATAAFDNRMPPPNLTGLAAKIAPRPLLLMYAAPGKGGQSELSRIYPRAAGPSSTLWEIPGAEHMGGIRAQPAEYERRVVGFYDRALL